MPTNPTYTNLGSNVHRIVYDDGKRFFIQVLSRDEESEKTTIKATLLLNTNQSEPYSTDWQEQEIVADDTLKSEVEDPIGDLIIWLLRLLGKRYSKPFGAVN